MLISTIIPAYGNLEFLLEAVHSILDQSGFSHQIIVVDDGNPAEKMKYFDAIKNIPEVECLHLDKNRGLANARNQGFLRAKGDYVRFLDADDLFIKNGLTEQIASLTNQDLDCAIGDFRFCNTQVSEMWDLPGESNPIDTRSPMNDFLFRWERGVSIPIHTALFKMEALRKLGSVPFVSGFRAKEDWIFWVMLSFSGTKFGYVPGMVALYRQHGKNMCGDFNAMSRSWLEATCYISTHIFHSKEDERKYFIENSLNHFYKFYAPRLDFSGNSK